MAAHRLVRAGWRVLLLERGDWVPRGPSARDPRATMVRTPQYSNESAYHCVSGGEGEEIGGIFCVGGPSVFYGAASFRMREEDFRPGPEVVNGSKAQWPFGYDALEPYYGEAERLLGVAGDDSGDPTRPPRRDPYPVQPPPFAPISRRFRDSALELGLHPFPIPLAINFSRHNGRPPCDACRQCDTYICAIQAKNDADVAVISPLRQQGLEVRANTVVTRLVESGGRITGVLAWDRAARQNVSFSARHVILAAGAMASPHLLLASQARSGQPGWRRRGCLSDAACVRHGLRVLQQPTRSGEGLPQAGGGVRLLPRRSGRACRARAQARQHPAAHHASGGPGRIRGAPAVHGHAARGIRGTPCRRPRDRGR